MRPLRQVSSPLRLSRAWCAISRVAARRRKKGEEEPRGSLFKKDLNSRRVKGPSPDSGRCLFVTWRLRDRSVHDIISQDSSLPTEPRYRTIRIIKPVNRHISQRC